MSIEFAKNAKDELCSLGALLEKGGIYVGLTNEDMKNLVIGIVLCEIKNEFRLSHDKRIVFYPVNDKMCYHVESTSPKYVKNRTIMTLTQCEWHDILSEIMKYYAKKHAFPWH
jgi:hypothetical protein